MPNLSVEVKNKIAKAENKQIVCGNSDYTIEFLFDEEWAAEPVKIARFVWNNQFIDIQFTGDTCEVPPICKTNTLAVGVYAGELRTTTPAIFACHKSILCENAAEPTIEPTEYEEIMRLLSDETSELERLKTENEDIKNSLNELQEQFIDLELKIPSVDGEMSDTTIHYNYSI